MHLRFLLLVVWILECAGRVNSEYNYRELKEDFE